MKKISKRMMLTLLVLMLTVGMLPHAVMATDQGASFFDRLDAIYNSLTPEEKGVVSEARDAVDRLTIASEVFPNMWGKVSAKLVEAANPAEYDLITETNFMLVGQSLVGLYYPDGNGSFQISQDVKDTLDQLAELAGHPGTTNQVTRQSLESYANALENAVIDEVLTGKTLNELLDLLSNMDNLIQLLSDAQSAVLSQQNLNEEAQKVQNLLNGLGITGADIKADAQILVEKVDPSKRASKALLLGYIKSSLQSSDGDTRPPSTGGVPTAPNLTPPHEVEQIVDTIAEVLEEIAPERAEQATQSVKDAIRQASTIDVASRVVNENGLAQLNLSLNAIASMQFEAIKATAGELNQLLHDSVPDAALAPVIATFDLGSTREEGAQITISEDVVHAARANNIDALAIKVNGVSLAIDMSDLDGDITLDINFAAREVASDVTEFSLASGVYTFNVSANGEAKTSFNRPIEISIPIEDVADLDTELLSLAKIVDGQLIFYGGAYDEKTGTFIATRNSFSSYVVVENKVTFNDTAAYAWAHREIDVVAAKGVIEGRGGGVFDPAATLTRAEYATMLVRAFGLEDANATDNFTDVNDGDWFQPYVAAAVNEGLIMGRGNNIFDPHANVTRAEMATMAARAMKSVRGVRDVNDVNAQLNQFDDTANIAATMQADVALSISRGIIVGVGDHAFDPNGHSTRAQAAVVIYRLLNQ